jgi:hypothetical protein
MHATNDYHPVHKPCMHASVNNNVHVPKPSGMHRRCRSSLVLNYIIYNSKLIKPSVKKQYFNLITFFYSEKNENTTYEIAAVVSLVGATGMKIHKENCEPTAPNTMCL